MAGAISMLALILYLQGGMGYEFQNTSETSGIFIMRSVNTYVTYDQWRIVYYVDIEQFHGQTRELKRCVKRIETLCNHVPQDKHCSHLLERFQVHLQNIDKDMEYIYSFRIDAPRRVKRSFLGLNVVGSYVYKPLLGLMDEEDASEIFDKINRIINHQERHKVFVREQLSIIKETVRITNETFTSFQNNMMTFQTEIEKLIDDQDRAMVQQMTKQYLTSIATLMLIEHNHFMKKLKFATSKAFNGDFTEMVTINELARDINKINIFLDGEHMVPVRTFDDIRTVSSCRHYLTENKVWIEISVPVVRRKPYVLTKVIALPVVVENRTILFDLHDSYFLVDDRNTEYIPTSETEIEKCQRAYGNNLICLPRRDVFLRNEEVCESGVLFGSDINNILRKCLFRYVDMSNFVRKLEERSYYVYSKNPIRVIEQCTGSVKNETKLSGRGILALAPNCDIQIGRMKVMNKNVFSTNKTAQVDIPFQFVNVTAKIKQDLDLHKSPVKIPSMRYVEHEKDFHAVAHLIEKQENGIDKEETVGSFTDLPAINFFSKLLTPITIILLLIIILMKVTKKTCCCW